MWCSLCRRPSAIIGLLASGPRSDNIARARRLLDMPMAQPETGDDSCAAADDPKPLTSRVRAAAVA
jgi:hypothetical protein